MHRYTRTLLTSLTAAAILAIAISNANANRFQITSQNIRAVWRSLELGNTILSGVVRCPVTLEGSFHSATITKAREALVGLISRASVAGERCSNGSATIHSESLPWHIAYRSFEGELPRIRGVRLLLTGVFFEVATEGNTCSARTEEGNPANGIVNLSESTGEVTGLTAEESVRIPLTNGRGGILCTLARGYFRGTGTATQLGSTAGITIRLI